MTTPTLDCYKGAVPKVLVTPELAFRGARTFTVLNSACVRKRVLNSASAERCRDEPGLTFRKIPMQQGPKATKYTVFDYSPIENQDCANPPPKPVFCAPTIANKSKMLDFANEGFIGT